MKIFIITEGGRGIGYGHVTRCLSITQAFEEKGIIPEFVVNGDKTIEGLLGNKRDRILNWLKKQKELFKLITDSDMTIVDSYLAPPIFYSKLSQLTGLPVYIDDNREISYPKGIVINAFIWPKRLVRPLRKSIIYLRGTKYIPLRKDFWKVPKKIINERIGTVMITFGGNDSKNLTEKVLAFLNRDYPRLRKKVIIGKGFRYIRQIREMRGKHTDLIFWPGADKMKQIMLKSDIAISAGGQTLYELACVGVPTIAIAVAENQLNNVNGQQREGFVEYAGWCEDVNIVDSIKNKLNKLYPKEIRVKKYLKGREIIDGLGAKRIVAKLLDYHATY